MDHARHTWATVKGPMESIQMHFKEIQWQARWYNGTLQFRDHEGQLWRLNPAYGVGILRPINEDARMSQIWFLASNH
eukprot:2882949-Karenia_brevis.AAC.1